MFYFDKEKQEIKNWIQAAVAVAEQKFYDRILALQNQVDVLKNTNADLLREIDNLKSQIDALKNKPPETPARNANETESIFYLEETTGAFLPNKREEIPEKIKRAANVDELKNFLAANDTETSQKFQRLLESHLKQVNNFVDKLNLENTEDAELSESVTAKYFKLFQNVFFDNIVVAISRGVKDGNIFYFEFLDKVNEYLSGCGIYTLNVTAGAKVTDDDYKNMTPQIRKTGNQKFAEIVAEIERLPYRINYLNEFGEQKFLQYNGVMTVYKVG